MFRELLYLNVIFSNWHSTESVQERCEVAFNNSIDHDQSVYWYKNPSTKTKYKQLNVSKYLRVMTKNIEWKKNNLIFFIFFGTYFAQKS